MQSLVDVMALVSTSPRLSPRVATLGDIMPVTSKSHDYSAGQCTVFIRCEWFIFTLVQLADDMLQDKMMRPRPLRNSTCHPSLGATCC